MKNRILTRTFLVLSAILISSHSFSAGADTTGTGKQAEDTVWKLEEAYFSNLYKANYEQVLALVQDQFLGWPGGLQHPISKEESARFMKELIPKPTSCRITIEKEGIRISGTVALTHYTLRVSCPDSAGGTKTQTSRITHTWVKEGGTWKLLGGMSNDK
jgi:ketosteroid isomerase-like protein